jgi:hypothetical protein
MKMGILKLDPLSIQKAIELALRLRSEDPQKFVQAAMSEEVSPLGEDLKELYLLGEMFGSREAVCPLEKLLLLIFERSGSPREIPDEHSFRLAIEEFREGIDSEMARWKLLVSK